MPVPSPTPADTTIRCPHDNTLMEKEVAGGITVDRCNACGRLWLDDGELKRLVTSKDSVDMADSGPFGRESKRAALGPHICPRDKKPLLEIKHPQQPDVLIEYCPGCRGVLLDAGELHQLAGQEAETFLAKVRKLVHW